MALRDLPFAKWEGCGNDYLFVDLRGSSRERIEAVVELAPEISQAWSDRRAGIGADGLVLLLNEPEADLRLAMWNADGSRGAVCGTALRCTTAILAKERGGAAHLRLASDAGFHATRVDHHSHGIFRTAVDLGRPSFDAAAIPFDSDRAPGASDGATTPFRVRLPIGTARSEGMVLSMGNPHLIVPVDVDPADLDLETLGPPLESADYFPDRANVSFAQVVDSDSIVQRTYERGTGETLSCGSGACAAVVALTSSGQLERGREVSVRMPGGKLGVEWLESGEVWLSGPAKEVFTGRADLPLLAGSH